VKKKQEKNKKMKRSLGSRFLEINLNKMPAEEGRKL